MRKNPPNQFSIPLFSNFSSFLSASSGSQQPPMTNKNNGKFTKREISYKLFKLWIWQLVNNYFSICLFRISNTHKTTVHSSKMEQSLILRYCTQERIFSSRAKRHRVLMEEEWTLNSRFLLHFQNYRLQIDIKISYF